MTKNRNKTLRRALRLDRRVEPGEVWPVLGLDLIGRALRESLLVAKLRERGRRWQSFGGKRN